MVHVAVAAGVAALVPTANTVFSDDLLIEGNSPLLSGINQTSLMADDEGGFLGRIGFGDNTEPVYEPEDIVEEIKRDANVGQALSEVLNDIKTRDFSTIEPGTVVRYELGGNDAIVLEYDPNAESTVQEASDGIGIGKFRVGQKDEIKVKGVLRVVEVKVSVEEHPNEKPLLGSGIKKSVIRVIPEGVATKDDALDANKDDRLAIVQKSKDKNFGVIPLDGKAYDSILSVLDAAGKEALGVVEEDILDDEKSPKAAAERIGNLKVLKADEDLPLTGRSEIRYTRSAAEVERLAEEKEAARAAKKAEGRRFGLGS